MARNRGKTYNPRNKQSNLFRKLTRLLSGPIVNFRSQLPVQNRRRQLDNFKFKSASGQQFKKSTFNPYENLQSNFYANQNRIDRYIDFDQMEYMPEIASALDIYADEMTTSTALSPLLDIKCPNEEIKSLLENLYHSILNVDYNLYGWCRSMCKYGDFFLYLDIDETEGVKYIINLPQQEIERLEGEDKTNPNYVQYQWNSGGMTFENWQVAHFRVIGNDKYSPYGTSILDPARRIWRQLVLLEDAMMAYRIVRSPERKVFYVDVGGIDPQDIEQYMQKVMSQMKRNQVLDADTGRVDLRYNPLSVEEDYFIPVRGGVSTRVENLPGGTYTGDIDDVKYLRDKLFSALKVPASYISRGDGAEEDKATLAQKDIRFARTIQRLQRVVVSELEKIGVIHLFTLGYRAKDLISFELSLNNPSKIAELQELEHWRVKFDVASSATEGYFSRRWVAQRLFNLSEEEYLKIQREMFFDRKFETELEKSVEGIAGETLEAGGAGGGLDLGGDTGDSPDLDLGGEETPEAPADAPGDEGVLLSEPTPETGELPEPAEAPANRDRSKGKEYIPVKNRGGDMRKYSNRKKMRPAHEKTSSTKRNVFPGSTSVKDLASIPSLSENLESTYIRDEEEKLFTTTAEVDRLIESLEVKREKND
jgi:hypothetical protein